MTRVEKDKYAVLVRSDYLYELGKLSKGDRQKRDELIRQAIELFLTDYTFADQQSKIQEEVPRLRILSRPGQQRPYHMYLELVSLPDILVDRMDLYNQTENTNTPTYAPLGTALNAALRVYLQLKAVINKPKRHIGIRSLMRDKEGDCYWWDILEELSPESLDKLPKMVIKVSSEVPMDEKKQISDLKEARTTSALQRVRNKILSGKDTSWRCSLYVVNPEGSEDYLFQAKITCTNRQEKDGRFLSDMIIEKEE